MTPINDNPAGQGGVGEPDFQSSAGHHSTSRAISMKDDALAFDTLAWAFSGKHTMPESQHCEVRATIRSARRKNRESAGKRRSRFGGLGPTWGKLV